MKRQQKRQHIRTILFRILFVAALAVFCFSAFQLLREWKRYHDGEQEYDALASAAKIQITGTGEEDSAADEPESNVIVPASESQTAGGSGPEQPEYYIDFAYLSSINSDVVGWISIPNTRIDYPVVQTDNNEDYLRNSFRGVQDWIGCPFVDCRVNGDFTSPVTYVYGHDLNNGAMFPDIKNYREQSYWAENPYFYIYTPTRTLTYQVFSVHTASETDGTAFTYSFADAASYQTYLDYLRSIAYYDTGVTVTADNRIVALVTCETDRDYRFVVNGVLIQEIEETH